MKLNRSLAALAFAALIGVSQAQVLSTGFTTNNGQSGNMFDLNATVPLIVTGFDINVDAGAVTINVYSITGGGTFLGQQSNAAAWTLEGSFPVNGAGLNLPTALPQTLAIPVNPGTPTGIYITVTVGTGLNYTTGPANSFQGTLATDGILSVTSGIGKALPLFTGANFGGLTPGTTASRQWSGNVYYFPSNPPNNGTGQAPQAGLATLNVNDARDVDNYPLVSGGNGPYSVSVVAGTNMNFRFGGAPNQPIVFLSGPLNPGSLVLPAGIGQLDIGTPNGGIPTDILVLSDGAGQTGFLPSFFVLNGAGSQTITLNASGLTPGLALSFQCVMYTGGPTVIACSNAVTVNTL